MPSRLCAHEGCDMPVMAPYTYCSRHILLSTRCIVPGCKRARLWPDLTCFLHVLDDALVPDEDVEKGARDIAR